MLLANQPHPLTKVPAELVRAEARQPLPGWHLSALTHAASAASDGTSASNVDSTEPVVAPGLSTVIGKKPKQPFGRTLRVLLPRGQPTEARSGPQMGHERPISRPRQSDTDDRTGLTHQSTVRHETILSYLESHSVAQFVEAVKARYPHPSTAATWLGSAIGALPRASIYGFQRITTAGDLAILKNALRALKKLMRLTQPIDTEGVPVGAIAAVLQSPRLSRSHRLFLSLQILTGGHRATSVENIQVRDVLDPLQLTEDYRPTHFSLTPVREPTSAVAIIFRDTKTAATIGTYALHLSLTPTLAEDLKSLLRESATSQAHLPVHRRFLFGVDRALIRRHCGQLLPARSLRRTMLRMICGPLGVSPEEALLFSRHTTVKQLRTYLGAGVVADKERDTTSSISALIPTLITPLM